MTDLLTHTILDQFELRTSPTMGTSYIRLGAWHGYDAILGRDERGRVALSVGCRRFNSANEARMHWCGNRSPAGQPRPFASLLIAICEALCRREGWNDWASEQAVHARLHSLLGERDHRIVELQRSLNLERACVANRDKIIAEQAADLKRLRDERAQIRRDEPATSEWWDKTALALPVQDQLNNLRQRITLLEEKRK